MKDIIGKIREAEGLSQTEFADALGVSFSTVNRWENGKACPNHLAQTQLYEQTWKHGIQMTEFVLNKIRGIAESIPLSPYHLGVSCFFMAQSPESGEPSRRSVVNTVTLAEDSIWARSRNSR